jgi:uncharacterized SAM-binding protein YcdF (DUF218 family)
MNMELQSIARFLINPLLYLFLGCIWLVFKKRKLKLSVLLAAYVYFISIPFTGYVFSHVWKMNDTFNPDRRYDAVVVLAGVSDIGWHLHRDGLSYIPPDFFASSDTTDRLLAGIYFVKSGNAKILLIGDVLSRIKKQGRYITYDEGVYARKLAAEMGLRENQIKVYGRIKRTTEEAEGVKHYINAHPTASLLLVTSEKHMRRAVAMFRKQGLNPDIFSVNREDTELTWKAFVPHAYGIFETEKCLYEFVGYIGYYLKGNL